MLTMAVFFACALIYAQAPPAIKLLEPSKHVALDGGFEAEHLVISKWERGYLLGYDIDRSVVLAADRTGKLALRAQISPAGASHVLLRDVSASPGGTFAVAFSAAASNGGPASFIAWLDHTGKTARLVQVSAAVPYLVCFADDGSLWAAVHMRLAENPEQEIARYDVLRHYGADGKLIGSALRREAFPARSSPDWLAEYGSLTASHDRIGLFAPTGRIWVEISYAGTDLGHWTLPGPKVEFTQAFLSQSDQVYVHQQERADHTHEALRSYIFDKASNTLQELDTSTIHWGRPASLKGVDGDELVYMAAPRVLKWSSYVKPTAPVAQ